MITKINIEKSAVIEHIKMAGLKTVLDVGGAMDPWAQEVVTHYIDLFDPRTCYHDPKFQTPAMKRSNFFLGDINNAATWDAVRAFTEAKGKFSFTICTHTLEDLRNPQLALERLPVIADGGFISMPSKAMELAWNTEYFPAPMDAVGIKSRYRGYCHHRWIFSIVNEKLVRIFPKLNFIDHLEGMEWADDPDMKSPRELNFMWTGNIPFETVNGDYLGPSPQAVFDMYRTTLREGI